MSVNKAILVGNCGKDPEVKSLEGGTTVARFTLATSESYKNKSGEVITNTEWHNIVAWRNLADICDKWVKKGQLLYVEGKITNRSYEDREGVKRYTTEIVADQIRMLGKKSDSTQSHATRAEDDLPESDSDLNNGGIYSPADTSDDLPF